MSDSADAIRSHLARALAWEEAHVGFDKAIDGIPSEKRGAQAPGFDHSPWQLLEHLRLAQKDILDFCMNANYVHALSWPDDYWPKSPAPPSPAAWDQAVADLRADRATLAELATDPRIDLTALVPTGKGAQTYLRALLLVIDHGAYHLGQIVAVRRALGTWK